LLPAGRLPRGRKDAGRDGVGDCLIYGKIRNPIKGEVEADASTFPLFF
jgi:hypothetical protein